MKRVYAALALGALGTNGARAVPSLVEAYRNEPYNFVKDHMLGSLHLMTGGEELDVRTSSGWGLRNEDAIIDRVRTLYPHLFLAPRVLVPIGTNSVVPGTRIYETTFTNLFGVVVGSDRQHEFNDGAWDSSRSVAGWHARMLEFWFSREQLPGIELSCRARVETTVSRSVKPEGQNQTGSGANEEGIAFLIKQGQDQAPCIPIG